MLAFRTNLKSTWPTMQALGSTSSNTCSSQLELHKGHSVNHKHCDKNTSRLFYITYMHDDDIEFVCIIKD